MELLAAAGLIFLLYLVISTAFSKNDPFEFLWDHASLNYKYQELKTSSSAELDQLYSTAKTRIDDGLAKEKWFSESFFLEVDYVMRTRRSLDILLKKTNEYAAQLAVEYGYRADSISKSGFYCPGWNRLWELYHHHKSRILNKGRTDPKLNGQTSRQAHSTNTNNDWTRSHSTNNSKTSSNEANSDWKQNHTSSKKESNDQSKTSNEKIREKNQGIFDDIWDLKELKKKYFKLAQLNHPDHGGSDKAMKLVNLYYAEALERIMR